MKYLRGNLFFALLMLFSLLPEGDVVAQTPAIETDIALVKKIADRILSLSSFDFISRDSTRVIAIANEQQINNAADVLIRSPYNSWSYWNGVLNVSFLRIAATLNEEKYKKFVFHNYNFAFDNAPFFKQKFAGKRRWDFPFATLFNTKELDDCGAMGAGLALVNAMQPRKDFQRYLDSTYQFIMHSLPRLKDKTIVRNWPHKPTIWADDLYMSVSFLANMGSITKDEKYFSEAYRQVVNFNQYLFNKNTGLYFHGWYADNQANSVAQWSRCNGWIMMGAVELLNKLPENSAYRKPVINILLQHIIGVSRYQDPGGLWHQLLDRNDAYLETSSTAMFTYSIARAVNMGWIHKKYISIALAGWAGIKSTIDADGQVRGICMGTGIEDNLGYYYSRPTPLNDIHGLGPVLLAADEIIQYNRKPNADDEE
jgi:unsaturated rhamnogalacturonyl hydrolase